ncbi:hypothetical protein QT397_02390 (plasmid) [Microbulbifer sp. MKSA007]|nr:hypothetical protein QT397_02390 [Microbulbifer sp. MKSA007]
MSQLLEKYGLDVFDEHEMYINLLVEQELMKIDFNFSDVKELIQNSFIVEREDQSIVVPKIEEDYEFTVRLDELNPEEFSIILQRFRSYNPSKGEKFLKSISMNSHPRLVSYFLKSF